MRYLAVLGRQPEISMAELEAVTNGLWTGPAGFFPPAAPPFGCSAGALPNPSPVHVDFATEEALNIDRLGGCLKLAIKLEQKPLEYLQVLPEGKLTIGVSDYTTGGSRKSAQAEALKLKKILVRHGRSVRVVENKDAVLSTATSLHNGLSGKNPRKVELIKTDEGWYRVIGVQDIDAYSRRDQARPARDAKVGMLPPKLAQILINLCGSLEPGAVVLDPFCGTGVLLQEALLMGYRAYGTDISERMIEYAERNLKWLVLGPRRSRPSPRGSRATPRAAALRIPSNQPFQVSQGDAISFCWEQPIDAVACEGYLGKPFSKVPSEVELKEQKQECKAIVVGFLRNLASQIKSGTPVVIAVPAWLRGNGEYERMQILDEIDELGYNVNNRSREGLLYYREQQVVARDIIILRKK